MNPNTIILTDSAAQKISELIFEEDNSKLSLRVFITGGGCSGFQYGFVFDENINAEDICVLKKVKRISSSKQNAEEEDEDEGGEGAGSIDARLGAKAANTDMSVLKKKKKLKPHKNKKEEEGEGEGGAGSTEVRLIVDPMSFQYLMGAEIDYKSDIKGEQFIIRNPMAKTTCGCGSSFSA